MMLPEIFRQLPPFKGKRRLANLLFNRTISNAENTVVEGLYATKYLLPNLKDNISLDIFVNGIYEEDTIDLLESMLPRGGHYLDLGANIGAILVPLCIRRSDIHAIGVEAAPWIFHYLEKNIAGNGLKNVSLINKALFDQDGIQLDFFSPAEKFGKGSLSPVFSRNAVKVITARVDTIVKENNLPKVDIIKVDVEGFEYFVFKGAETLLTSPDPPEIIFEFVDWAEKQAMGLEAGAAQQYLLDLGYELFVVENKKTIRKINHVLREGGYNLLASRKRK